MPTLSLDDPDEGKILFKHKYTPNHPRYEGQTFESYEEMIEKCPYLEARKIYMDNIGLPFTPYTHEFVHI